MNYKQANIRAMQLSKDLHTTIAVVQATPGELQQPYYVEAFSTAIPQVQVRGLFVNGKLVSADYKGQELTPEEITELLRSLKKGADLPACPRCGASQQKTWLLACKHTVCRECVTTNEEIDNLCNPCRWLQPI